MDTIPENTQNAKEETLHKKHRILQKTMRIIFVGKSKILIFYIFLFLLLIRRPVLSVLNFFAGASALSLLFFFFGSMIGSEILGKDAPIIIIGMVIFLFGSLTASWFYDALLLRLAPAKYEIMLFD
ncbi:hypothetical protein CEV08_04230 [Bartonella tribocorum]|uniref:Uncharacterized protein n=1 Tax=Bartonella tribocorum TaxID=85701 RepID=A0A2M6UW22_9HYPH|nr:hypothetical protein CEV08_04230 [Bartonella tribocorum]